MSRNKANYELRIIRRFIFREYFLLNIKSSSFSSESTYLKRYSVHDHKQQLKRPLGFVGSMCPESVSPGCDSQAGYLIQKDCCNQENHNVTRKGLAVCSDDHQSSLNNYLVANYITRNLIDNAEQKIYS